MKVFDRYFIGGEWVDAPSRARQKLFNPATDTPYGEIALGTAKDVDAAVRVASEAFTSFSETTVAERLALLKRILNIYERRRPEIAGAITVEMGAPRRLSREAQAAAGSDHLRAAIEALEEFQIERPLSGGVLRREPVGVCGLITPWNWPMNQIAGKVAPAIAAGCTMVLKASELTPMSAVLFAEILEEAGVPKGVFNLLHGEGRTVGAAIATHPLIDMVSFTGSTAAGVQVAINAAPTVKRVTQELGGKSPNILLRDADFDVAVRQAVEACMENSGQSCNAPTRLIVPSDRHDEIAERAEEAAKALRVGDPENEETDLGPVVSRAHLKRVRNYIEVGQQEGAILIAGGAEPIDDLPPGYFVKPTVFAHVTPDMTIAREEIFGPVLSILSYDDEEEAVRIANDTPYGLAAYVSSQDREHAIAIARRLRAGQVHVNMTIPGADMPFGGFRQSGNGREGGIFGIEDFTEIKAIALP
ncbi:aldehyde dehydrogenase [Parvibaculum lavamentivorans DS-1]|uniref:Aldehyde dehydrogenase n=1 Tax=Parvibaculum lavamentivorans (strain DS-1 / DSM 13023 / NCIMB 13966) TaxID=402881 RepID=A7HPF6_PARL1|nr:aldehyde dehydrogenase family protein [Parvibaculum lavamentivorans]ABS61789.1 aldehyde dehydrogenase [Parvibaculum lavamentivorans DS-1]